MGAVPWEERNKTTAVIVTPDNLQVDLVKMQLSI